MVHGQAGKGKIIVFGILFWYPLAGVTYQFLHYLIGLRRLGYDAYYIEDSGRWVYDPDVNDLSPDASSNIAKIVPVLERYGFGDRWAFRGHYPVGRCYGMPEGQILELYREADALLNVTGAQEIREEHLACRRRIYVESDPVASQIRVVQDDPEMIAMLEAHDTHFTFGENVGQPDFGVPIVRYHWLPTRQPVVLDLWADGSTPDRGRPYTTITTWDNKGKDIVWNGETYYWTKKREFKKFMNLPEKTGRSFELATCVGEENGRKMLTDNAWRIAPAAILSADAEAYRRYIGNSRGEFTVAKDQYTRLKSGWFSDRSACYLAAGRPVITQETGFSKVLPTGKGLFGFRTMEDIMTAVDSIESDYAGHSRAAREIAREFFEAEKVLSRLMTEAGL